MNLDIANMASFATPLFAALECAVAMVIRVKQVN